LLFAAYFDIIRWIHFEALGQRLRARFSIRLRCRNDVNLTKSSKQRLLTAQYIYIFLTKVATQNETLKLYDVLDMLGATTIKNCRFCKPTMTPLAIFLGVQIGNWKNYFVICFWNLAAIFILASGSISKNEREHSSTVPCVLLVYRNYELVLVYFSDFHSKLPQNNVLVSPINYFTPLRYRMRN
jgi:hypothetical protein